MSIDGRLDVFKQAAVGVMDAITVALTALTPVKTLILDLFGWAGLIATYIALGVIALLVIWRLGRISFAALKYLVIPAVGLAFLVTLVSPYSFAAVLPVTVTLCSFLLLIKG